ncbi:alpha-methylacyl-CoA racemase [Aureococcus anophagefferens]|nr:alpha-methylacyl-CoA racemase [Aureococcus anophagefferens]
MSLGAFNFGTPMTFGHQSAVNVPHALKTSDRGRCGPATSSSASRRPRGGALTKSTLRVRTWWRLLREYGSMKRVYAAHAAQDFFVYGTPPARYEDLGSHVAFAQLEALRARKNDGGAFASTVTFAGDFPVLPTYLPIEEGAAACLGILGLAAADLHELRGGSPQEVTVRQSDAGLSTAGYMFLDVEPDGNYGAARASRAPSTRRAR